MRGELAKAIRRGNSSAIRTVLQSVGPPLQTALGNEMVTRQRVEALESYQASLLSRGFLGRLKWLFTGR